MAAWHSNESRNSRSFPKCINVEERAPLRGVAAVWVLLVAFATPAEVRGLLTPATEVPVVKADAGPCAADFTVTDNSNKPLYDAKIHVIVRYGFMSKRKQDLEVGTNSDGKARIEGLPSQAKKPLEFHIRSGQQTKSVTQDPEADCHASFAVVLGTS